jgi:hypothetical protein
MGAADRLSQLFLREQPALAMFGAVTDGIDVQYRATGAVQLAQ